MCFETQFDTLIFPLFQIFAEETGTVAKQQHNASIVITVTDVNEYDPVFTQSGFYGNVSENAANGTAVVKVGAKPYWDFLFQPSI